MARRSGKAEETSTRGEGRMERTLNNNLRLTRRSFLRAAGLTTAALGCTRSLLAATPLALGPTRTIYRDSPFFLDLPVTTIRDGRGGFYFFHCRGAAGPNYKTHGTLSDPFSPVVWDKNFASFWDINGYNPGAQYKWWSPWIMNIYEITRTEWIAFCHIEKSPNHSWGPSNSVENFSAGIGYSNDGGNSWTFCGETLCLCGDPTGKNIGAAAVTTKNDGGTDYFYVYYNDINSAGQKGMAVARSKVGDVVTAARNKSVSPWKKYYKGGWTENGWAGAATVLLVGTDTHGDIQFNSTLGKYLFVGDFMSAARQAQIVLYESADGISWHVAEVIDSRDSRAVGWLGYPWFAGAGSDDGYKIDKNFYVFWMQPPGHQGIKNGRLFRREVKVG